MNDPKNLLTERKETDLTTRELQIVEKFKEDGMPGIHSLNEVVMTKALDLYMAGKSYMEICTIVSTRKELILYLAHKFKWYDTKMEFLEILNANIAERIVHAKLTNLDFVLQIQQFYKKKIGTRITRYLASGDESVANEIDGRDIERFAKYSDLLDKLTAEKNQLNPRGPAVGLNLGDGVTITKVGENEVTITPRNKTHAEMLNELANLKRAEESKPINDISNKDTKTNTEKEEK
jgi:predicted transport protein/antitoxin component of MazEF toxin-antitoxin module